MRLRTRTLSLFSQSKLVWGRFQPCRGIFFWQKRSEITTQKTVAVIGNPEEPEPFVVAKTLAQGAETTLEKERRQRKLLSKPTFSVKLLCASSSPAAEYLKLHGVQIIKGDRSKTEVLEEVLSNVDAVYLHAPAADTHPIDETVKTYTRIIRLAEEMGEPRIIYSSHENVKRVSDGKFSIPSFSHHPAIETALIRSDLPHTLLYMPLAYESLYSLCEQDSTSGRINICFPANEDVDMCSLEDIGRIVWGLLAAEEKFNRMRVLISAAAYSGQDIADECMQVVPRKSVLWKESPSDLVQTTHGRVLPNFLPPASELPQYFAYLNEYSGRLRDPIQTEEVSPSVRPFELWLRSEADASMLLFTRIIGEALPWPLKRVLGEVVKDERSPFTSPEAAHPPTNWDVLRRLAGSRQVTA